MIPRKYKREPRVTEKDMKLVKQYRLCYLSQDGRYWIELETFEDEQDAINEIRDQKKELKDDFLTIQLVYKFVWCPVKPAPIKKPP